MKVTVYPKFTGTALEVEQDEADVLKAQGLLLDAPLSDDDRIPARVTVTPVFTGQPMQVSVDEAESLREQGLLIPEPEPEPVPAAPVDAAPTEDADRSEETQP